MDPAERGKLDLTAFLVYLRERLPRYAVPVFLRFVAEFKPTTHNNKQNKVPLRKEGVDPHKIKTGEAGQYDIVYWIPPNGNTYEPFGDTQWQHVIAGKAKL